VKHNHDTDVHLIYANSQMLSNSDNLDEQEGTVNEVGLPSCAVSCSYATVVCSALHT